MHASKNFTFLSSFQIHSFPAVVVCCPDNLLHTHSVLPNITIFATPMHHHRVKQITPGGLLRFQFFIHSFDELFEYNRHHSNYLSAPQASEDLPEDLPALHQITDPESLIIQMGGVARLSTREMCCRRIEFLFEEPD